MQKLPKTRTPQWMFRLGLAALAGFLASVVACSTGEVRTAAKDQVLAPTAGQRFEPCEDGSRRDCTVTIGEHEGYLTCFKGTQVCRDGSWGSCEDGELFGLQSSPTTASAGAPKLLALGNPADCTNNPCNPYCQVFDEQPDGGGISPSNNVPIFNWSGGALSSLPGGLINKGIKEPCQEAADCQFNRRCQNPTTGSGCEHSKCLTGGGLVASCDPCVADVCAADPSCCDEPYEHSCSHDPCTTGAALKSNCDPCVEAICDVDSDCCKNTKSWSASCVAKVSSVCGLSCPLGSEGTWSQSCVDRVATECGVSCGDPQPTSCAHNVCTQGGALDALCHPCVTDICDVDPYCCVYGWDSLCVGEVSSVCGESCPFDMSEAPPDDGTCAPWLPGQTDSSCSGIDLSVDVPCDDGVPVCNHGTETAPAGIRLIHFPANSQQYPSCAPSQTHPQMYECFTTEAIEPGHCTLVTGCPELTGNREIMVNPPGAAYVDECRCQDNWSLFSGGSCGAPQCAAVENDVSFRNVHLMIVLDRSGSMAGSKWSATTAALKSFFQDPDSAGLNVAFEYFPLAASSGQDGCGENSCSATPCSNPLVPEGALTADSAPGDGQEQALIDALEDYGPSGGTPTYPALDGALDWATAGRAANPDDFYGVVLVTDGSPTSCTTSTFSIASLAVDAYIEHGIKTYTIGMDGACNSCLDVVAKGGGTGSAFVIGTQNVEQDLVAAFQAIAQENSPCQFSIENGANIDPDDATLLFTPSGGGSPVALSRVNSAASCGEGWYYDDNTTPTQARLCSSTCQAVLEDVDATLDLAIGCKTAPSGGTQVVTEIYEPECPADKGPQWGFLTWEAETPDTGTVAFRARVALSEADLSSATWIDLGTARSSPTDTQSCSLTGPEGCPIDVFNALGSLPWARFPFLELEITLDGGASSVTLNGWQLSYSCVDEQ